MPFIKTTFTSSLSVSPLNFLVYEVFQVLLSDFGFLVLYFVGVDMFLRVFIKAHH